MSSRKQVLVTGGAGFLGSHLCERLLQKEYKVICLDNFFTGSRENIAQLLSNPQFELIQHDVCLPYHRKVDEIYNLACPASPIHYQSDPVQTTMTSILGASHLLNIALREGSAILQASTSEVYGDPTVHPQPEEYWGNVNPIGLRSCYDEGKRCAETLFFDYHRQYGLSIHIARIFNTYGPHMHPNDGRVISNFIVQALKGEPITIYGDGSQTRSFCFVDDLIEGLILLMETKPSVIGPINLGASCEFSIVDLAKLIIQMTRSKSPIIFHSLPQDDPKQRKPDIRLAQQKLGWAPRTTLEQGLFATIDYFATRLQKEILF